MTKYTPTGSWGVRVKRGFGTSVENYVNVFDNAEDDPEIQVFDNEEDEDETKKYFCAVCKAQLKYNHELGEWSCNNCGQEYDTKIQDVPVSNNRGFRVKPYHAISRYPTLDEEDPETPFAKGIQLDETGIGEIEEVQLVKSSPSGRIKHIRVKGNMVDALKLDVL